MTDLPELYRRATDQFGSRVRLIRDDQWGNDTPCTEWDVRALVHHLVYENVWFPPLMAGESVAQIGDRFEGELLGDDPKDAWEKASSASLAVAAEPGAFERSVALSRGPTPAEQYAWELIMDHAIHGWDLARGIGADDAIDPELAQRIWDWVQPMVRDLQASGAFGTPVEVSDDADVSVRLLAVLGRKA